MAVGRILRKKCGDLKKPKIKNSQNKTNFSTWLLLLTCVNSRLKAIAWANVVFLLGWIQIA